MSDSGGQRELSPDLEKSFCGIVCEADTELNVKHKKTKLRETTHRELNLEKEVTKCFALTFIFASNMIFLEPYKLHGWLGKQGVIWFMENQNPQSLATIPPSSDFGQ